MSKEKDYTIPSNNRELRLQRSAESELVIIPYQVITGNYDSSFQNVPAELIIPYQVITGNYDNSAYFRNPLGIIPYQVITGNYDSTRHIRLFSKIIPYQVITGNYDRKIKPCHQVKLYHTK